MRVVIASNNAKKRAEIAAILETLGIRIVPPDETRFVDVIEDGEDFAANARKKAEAFAAANDLPALADDSGLAVDALNGAPGIFSSRFAGEDATDAANNEKLLTDLQGESERSARFVCALHLAFPASSEAITAEGHVEGSILAEPDGNRGFGYDPLFFCPELNKSFAAASLEEKASVSHRGRALRNLAGQLVQRLADRGNG